MNYSRSDNGFSPLLGTGLELAFTSRFKGRAEYQYIDRIGTKAIGRTNAHYIGLALLWDFPLQKKASYTPAPTTSHTLPPPPPVVEPPKEQRIVIDEKMGGALFEFNKSEIRTPAAIDPVVSILRNDPSLNVTVIGHTDSVGSADYNQRLSENRANVVANYLRANGIAGNRIKVFGMGKMNPVADNSTDDGRARNRRVEFVISNAHLGN